MAQQKDKKATNSWVSCEVCFTNILHKDIEKHSTDCPPNPNTSTYSFIKDGILFGTVGLKTNEDIKGVSDKDGLVFLSQTAIQLCSLAIGEWATLRFQDLPPVAKIVWPTTEKVLSSVLLTKHAVDLSSVTLNSNVMVSRIPQDLPEASNVTLVILNKPKSLEVTPDLINRLQKSNASKIYGCGNKISLMYFGKVLKFEIKSIDCCSNLEQELERLSLNNSALFTMSPKTVWKIFCDDAQFIKEVSKVDAVSKIGGLDSEVAEIQEAINSCINRSHTSYGLVPSKSILLFGNSGTGKSSVANALAHESKANVVSICAPDLYSKYVGSAEETIRNLLEEAINHAPSIVILDEIDMLCPQRSLRMTDSEKRVVSTVLTMVDCLNEHPNVFVLATTNKPEAIDPALRRCGRLDRGLEIPTPSPKAREDILAKLLKGTSNDISRADLTEIALNSHGFVGADLVSLCSRAGINARRRGAEVIGFSDFRSALKHVRPSAMREVQIEVANVKWSDIGGQDRLKLILRQAVEWPLRHAESFVRLGITPPKGVLMFGPPGCSKTMIAKALATESGLNFLSIKGPELFSKWVGESEKAVREVFRKARQVAPSIIFFDEIDALGGERSSGSTASVQERVLAQLLTELDGVSPLGDVTVLAATNRPDRIDKALLRPGRLDRIVYVPLPDEATRKEIFKLKLAKMPVSGVNVDELVKSTDRYSGAEVNAVCHEAAMMALEENLEAQVVEDRHFKKALEMITPRTPDYLLKLYEDYLATKI